MPTDPAKLFEHLRDTAPQLTLPDGRKAWVVEGDLVLDEGQLDEHASRVATAIDRWNEALAGGARADEAARRLVAEQTGGRILRWHPDVVLRYRVARATFPDAALHTRVAAATNQAAADWMAVCGARFEHLAQHDEALALPDECVFEVVYQDSIPGGLIAEAFFPRQPRAERVLRVSALWELTTAYDRVGMLRHELGHVLGFRHEFVSPLVPGGKPVQEPGAPVTAVGAVFDARSCMHYPTAELGDPEFRITPLDAEGARMIYGSPSTLFEYCR